MFNPRIFNDQENFEEPSFNPADYAPSFLPSMPFEPFTSDLFLRDDPAFYLPTDFEMYEQGFPFMIDPAVYQSFQEDCKKLMPNFDLLAGFVKDGQQSNVIGQNGAEKRMARFADNRKIGTITVEERRQKVQRFLEKRKRRIFKKRISYACRKRVADTRVRVKGRFVTKDQARLLKEEHKDLQYLKEE